MAYSDVVLADAPVGYWKLDDNGVVAIDNSGQQHHGTYVGGPTFRNPPLVQDGTSVVFDGSTQYVDMGDILDFVGTAPFSIEVWLKANAQGGELVTKLVNATTDGYLLGISAGGPGGGTADFERATAGIVAIVTSDSAVGAIGVLSHVVGTYDGTTIRIYVNGSEQHVGGVASSQSLTDNAVPLRIGAFANGTVKFSGALDEVAIYDYALSATQISVHYAAGAPILMPAMLT